MWGGVLHSMPDMPYMAAFLRHLWTDTFSIQFFYLFDGVSLIPIWQDTYNLKAIFLMIVLGKALSNYGRLILQFFPEHS